MLNQFSPLINKVTYTDTDELTVNEIVASLRELNAWIAACNAEAIAMQEAEAMMEDQADWQAATQLGYSFS